jgi:hypothetical protein
MRNTLIAMSCLAITTTFACAASAPRRVVPNTGAAGTTGAAGNQSGAAGDQSGAAGTTGAAGMDAGTVADATGAAGTTGAAGMDAGMVADATGAAGATGAGGDMGTAGAGGDMGAAGAGGTPAPMVCMNSTVVTAGGMESNCPAKTGWKATAMPTPASGLDGISNTLLQPQYAIDGNTATRYSSGAMMEPGFYFQVDMGAAKMVSGITVDTSEGADITDVAQAYEVDLSTDGTNFTKIASCMYPAAPTEVVNFTATMARYVRYMNTAASATSWMSIHEFDILCN